MTNLRLKLVVCFFTLSALWANAIAHEVRPAIFTLDIAEDRSFNLNISGNFEALLANIGSEHSDTSESPNAVKYDALRQLPPEQLESEFRNFAPGWLNELGLSFDGAKAELVLSDITVAEVGDLELARISEANFQGKIPPQAEGLQWAYPKQLGSSILRINRKGEEVQAQWFDAGKVSEVYPIGVAPSRSAWQTFVDYVEIGFVHIVPKGLDHILFVLGLFLLSMNWRVLLAQVTAFTIAHSVTLALGLYGVLSISPQIVEPLIALSIVYVAIENIFTRKLHVWRPVIIFLFGLLHGLGFAGVLSEIGLPSSDYVLGLFAFNVGVELGQISVIVAAFALVGWFINKSWYRSRIAIPASCAIAVMGAWWFIERTLL